jgi:ribose transport system ATP-binding protein
VLEARGLVKRFPGVLALDSVDLVLRKGEVHALVGENGAGKSTLIKLLTGAYTPDGGSLLHNGREVSYSSPRAAQDDGISTIYQEVNLVPLMSVARNLFLGHEPRNALGLIDVRRMEREAESLLRKYGIALDVRAPLRSLGLGAQQMVAVARAVRTEADTVIMDEPTSSLETREVETLFGLVQQLQAAGTAILYVSHRLDELFRLCDQVTVLRDGRLVHSGPLAAQTRLSLVAMMLGRELEEVKAHGATAFGEGHDVHGKPVLEVRGLSRANVLHDIALSIRPGEVVGLGGLLGAGRSETARAIAGADPLDAGEVSVNGTPLKRSSTAGALRAGIAMLPEDRKSDGIVPGLSVRDNIALAALPRLSKGGIVSEKAIDALVDTFMKRLRIRASSPHQKVGELSGGNQQKVLLARLLCLEPKVLLLDEPTRGIDVGAKAEVQGLVEELAQQGLAVLLISSELEELVEGSDRIVVLRDGAVVDVLTDERVDAGSVMSAIADAGSTRDAAPRAEVSGG